MDKILSLRLAWVAGAAMVALHKLTSSNPSTYYEDLAAPNVRILHSHRRKSMALSKQSWEPGGHAVSRLWL